MYGVGNVVAHEVRGGEGEETGDSVGEAGEDASVK